MQSRKYRAIDMRFYWVRDRIRQNHFHIFREEGKKNLADYVTKHHSIWHHIAMRPRYVKSTKKDIEYSKDRRNGTGIGCAGNINPRGTRKPVFSVSFFVSLTYLGLITLWCHIGWCFVTYSARFLFTSSQNMWKCFFRVLFLTQ